MVSPLHSWLTDKGRLIPITDAMHEEIAHDYGFKDNIAAIKNGWIRFMMDMDGRLYTEMWDAGDLSAVERLEEFLYDYWVPDRPSESPIALEIHKPVNSYLHFSKGQIEEEGFKDLLASLIRSAMIRPRGRQK
jgi:hypothetical protein